MAKNVKKRNWAFVVYPDSAPPDWREQLAATGLQFCVSPLHDKDVNPDGTLKKPHYHVIVCYSGPTSYNVVLGLTDILNCPRPQPLEQIKGYYRYLTHKDNPEKHQYNADDIFAGNGFNIIDYVEPTRSEVDRILRDLTQFCVDADLTEYSELIEILMDSGDSERLSVAMGHTLYFTAYLRSRRFKRKGIPHDD